MEGTLKWATISRGISIHHTYTYTVFLTANIFFLELSKMMSSSHVVASPQINSTLSKGQIQLIIGPMFSGKTTELMRRMKRYQIANYKCLVIKYSKDDRYEKEGLATHDRQTLPAVAAERLADMEVLGESYNVIGVDEGQFFPDVVSFCDSMAENGKIVIVSALDGTFQKKGFGDILNLVPLAESVIKLSAVCMNCCGEGSFTKRKGQEKEVEVIGGADKYLAVCRMCFKSPIKDKENCTPTVKLQQSSDKMLASRKLFSPMSNITNIH